MGGYPGLLVMGGDSRSSRSRSWVRITAQYTGWTFFHRPICCKICNVSLKRQKKWIRGQGWPILNKKSGHWLWPRWQSGRFQNQKSNLGIGNDNISMFRYLNPGHRLNMHNAKSPVKQPAYELGTFRWRRHHPHFPLTTNRRWPKWRRLCLYRSNSIHSLSRSRSSSLWISPALRSTSRSSWRWHFGICAKDVSVYAAARAVSFRRHWRCYWRRRRRHRPCDYPSSQFQRRFRRWCRFRCSMKRFQCSI